MEIRQPKQGRQEHADSVFDGHLEHPMQSLSDGDRLKLIWEGTLLRRWARDTTLGAPSDRNGTAPEASHQQKFVR